MAILDFLKTLAGAPEKPDYEITDVDFGEGYENVKPKKFGTEVSQYASYVYSRLHVKVNRPFETVWRVKIFAPGGKLIQGRNEPEGYAGSFRCRFPETGTFFMNLAVGNRLNEFFTGLGAYGWALCDEDGNPILTRFFYTVSYDEQKRRKGYMSINSVEFACSYDGSDFITDFRIPSECRFMTDMKYLKCRLKYDGICDEPHKIKLDIEITKPGGAVSRFETEATVSNTGGYLTLPGWGNDSATCYYSPGDYLYRVLFEGNVLFSRELKFERSIRDSGNVEVRSLTLHRESQLSGCASGVFSKDGLTQPHLSVTGEDFLYPVVCFANYSPDDAEFLLKITGPDDILLTFAEAPAPAGYSLRQVFKKRELDKRAEINEMAFFKGFKKTCNGRFVKGEYLMSLYIRNWRGDMVCLKVSRVRVDWL